MQESNSFKLWLLSHTFSDISAIKTFDAISGIFKDFWGLLVEFFWIFSIFNVISCFIWCHFWDLLRLFGDLLIFSGFFKIWCHFWDFQGFFGDFWLKFSGFLLIFFWDFRLNFSGFFQYLMPFQVSFSRVEIFRIYQDFSGFFFQDLMPFLGFFCRIFRGLLVEFFRIFAGSDSQT